MTNKHKLKLGAVALAAAFLVAPVVLSTPSVQAPISDGSAVAINPTEGK